MPTLIDVNCELCTACGLCVQVCPIGLLEMGECGPVTGWESCIACGHCVASCPHGALTHRQAPLSEQRPRHREQDIDAVQAAEFLRSRRSVRGYHDRPIERDKLISLLNIGRYAPSGGNSQGVSWLVVEDLEIRRAVTAACVAYMDEWFVSAAPTATVRMLKFIVNRYHTNGTEVILWGAPCLVVTLASEPAAPIHRDSAVMALLYTQLFAPTLGLATCWAGLVEYALRGGYKPLLDVLQIPAGKLATGAMMVGYPLYDHQRLPERSPLDVTFR